jgi:hypothetical protein
MRNQVDLACCQKFWQLLVNEPVEILADCHNRVYGVHGLLEPERQRLSQVSAKVASNHRLEWHPAIVRSYHTCGNKKLPHLRQHAHSQGYQPWRDAKHTQLVVEVEWRYHFCDSQERVPSLQSGSTAKPATANRVWWA